MASSNTRNAIDEADDVDEIDISSLPLLPTHSHSSTEPTSFRPRTTSTMSVEERLLAGIHLRHHPINPPGGGSTQTKEDPRAHTSIVTPPHEQDFYKKPWYRGLIGLIFVQVLFFSASILSGALSSTNNLLSTDIDDIMGIIQDVHAWVTIYCPLSLLIYITPSLISDFASFPKWGFLTRLRRLCGRGKFMPRFIPWYIYICFIFVLVLFDWFTLTNLPLSMYFRIGPQVNYISDILLRLQYKFVMYCLVPLGALCWVMIIATALSHYVSVFKKWRGRR
jgi:hypothetical protein